jgi:hypothetical protein
VLWAGHPLAAIDGSTNQLSTAIAAPSIPARDAVALLVAVFGVAAPRAREPHARGGRAGAKHVSIGRAHPLAMELADDLEDVACGTGTPVVR